MSVKLTVYSKITKYGMFYLVDGRKLEIRIKLDFGHYNYSRRRDCLYFEMDFKDEDIYQLKLRCIKEAVFRWNNLILAGV